MKPIIITFALAVISFLISVFSFSFSFSFSFCTGNKLCEFLAYPMAFVFAAGYGGGNNEAIKMSIQIFLILWASIFGIYFIVKKLIAFKNEIG